MKFKQFFYIVPLGLLAACNSSDALTGGSTTDHPNGAIELSAGIVEGGSALVTRAGAEDNHTTPGHLTLKGGTQLALQVSGTWTGHTPSSVVQTTTATVGSETSAGSKHNNLSCSPVLYWDDYGTADPDNAATGRAEGLTIYGVAIDGKTSLPTELNSISDWTALSWTLPENQTAIGNTPDDKDLLISNNLQTSNNQSPDENDCGTYKFDKRTAGKLLEFRHALSKITVNLRANKGFTGNVFSSIPEVKLTSNDASTSLTEWPLTTGTVNITTGNITSQSGNAVVTMFNSATTTAGWTKTYEALVMPGSEFTSDNAIIARINADGNIYYVTAEKIRAAINSSTHATDGAYSTESGKNYVINVIVNKTDIDVTATVTDWTTVNAEEVAPKINVTVGYSFPGTAVRVNTFSFYRSLSLNDGYSTGESENLLLNGYYKRSSELTRSEENWTMDPVRYWSNHNQHYHFRLVWPNTTTKLKNDSEEEKNKWSDALPIQYEKWRPHVESKDYSGTSYQVIEIWNDPFQEVVPSKTDIADDYHPYPSNLAIARPDVGENAECTNNEPGHTRTNLYSGGICATEGKINLTFRFVMSQVEVQLTTTSISSSAVRLDDAKVELVNAYTHGYVKLGDRTVTPDGDKTTDELDYWKKETVGGTDTRFFHSAIVPQSLDGVRFKITITNTNGTVDTSDDTQDVYYADVEPILNSAKTAKVAPNGKWESGIHYVYNLNVSKTQIKATATLANWQTVEASQEIWF